MVSLLGSTPTNLSSEEPTMTCTRTASAAASSFALDPGSLRAAALAHRLRRMGVALTSVAVLLTSGCSTEASGDGKKPAKTSAGSTAAAAGAKPSAASAAVPRPKSAELLPIQAGQWTTFTIEDDSGTRKFTYAVLSKEGDAHWLDVSLEGQGRNTSLQLLVAIPNRKDPKSTQIRKVKMKLPNGKVQTLSGSMIQMAQKGFQDLMGRFAVPELAKLPQEDVTVPAGTFQGCYKRTEKVSMFGITDESTVWNHPAVPVMGMVKLVSKGGAVFELTGYGLKGAKASM